MVWVKVRAGATIDEDEVLEFCREPDRPLQGAGTWSRSGDFPMTVTGKVHPRSRCVNSRSQNSDCTPAKPPDPLEVVTGHRCDQALLRMETIETPTGDELIAHITESFHTGGSPFVVAMGLQVVHAETGFSCGSRSLRSPTS
ncbi:MAG: hypothetical protein R2705_21100 [Ilumatobacteraceae bacterium]